MEFKNEGRRWFTVADALIIIVIAAFIIGAAVMFMLPRGEETGGQRARVTLQLQLDSAPEGINKGDKAFFDGVEIGTVTNVDPGFYIVIVDAELEKGPAGYSAGESFIRVNSAFTLETKLCLAPGTVIAISEREG